MAPNSRDGEAASVRGAIPVKFLFALAFVLVLLPSTAQAEPFTIRFDWTVGLSGGSELLFGHPVNPGDTVKAAWTFDDRTVDSDPSPDFGFFLDPTATLALQHGGSTFQISGMSGLTVGNNNGDPAFDYIAMNGVGRLNIDGFRFFAFLTYLAGPPTVFTSDAFPGSLASLNGLTGEGDLFANQLGYESPCEDCYQIMLVADHARIIDSPAPVPEPATLTLLGIGLAATGWRARRRRAARTNPADGGSL